MTTEHSYRITLSNNKTEDAAISYLRSAEPSLLFPDADSRKAILQLLSLPLRFHRTFDAIRIAGSNTAPSSLVGVRSTDVQLIELKTTRKYLSQIPLGFFFGATENEFELARLLNEQYQFCFVSLHEKSIGHVYLSLKELDAIIHNKRIQYQIQLKRERAERP
jgi:hypothetical protein